MKLPTQRVTITPAEYILLTPGLKLLDERFTDALAGNFPYRHSSFRSENEASSIYKFRRFDEEMALRISGVRHRLKDLKLSRKIRLDQFELAAAAFALRLFATATSTESQAEYNTRNTALARKLETFRKRVKRKTITATGVAGHQVLSASWKSFVAWMRYFLLHSSQIRLHPSSIVKLHQEQRQKMKIILMGVVRSAFYKPIAEAAVIRLVTLALQTLRRGRRQTSLRELLASPVQHHSMLLDFISKRVSLKKGPDFPKQPWERMFECADRFHAYQDAKRSGAFPTPIAATAVVPTVCAIGPARVNVRVRLKGKTPLMVKEVLPPTPPWDETLRDFLGAWFTKSVPIEIRSAVVDRTNWLTKFDGLTRFSSASQPFTTFAALLAQCRPVYAENMLEWHVAWGLRFLLAAGRGRDQLYSDMQAGASRAAINEPSTIRL